MRSFLRPLAIICAFLLVSLAIGPVRPDLVEEVETHPTHLAMQQVAPKHIHSPIRPSVEIVWPGHSELDSQYSPKKEPRPPRRS